MPFTCLKIIVCRAVLQCFSMQGLRLVQLPVVECGTSLGVFSSLSPPELCGLQEEWDDVQLNPPCLSVIKERRAHSRGARHRAR